MNEAVDRIARPPAAATPSPYAVMASLSLDLPPIRARTALVRHLVEATGAVGAALWLRESTGYVREAAWPLERSDHPMPPAVPDLDPPAALLGADVLCPLQEAGVTRAALVLTVAAGQAADAEQRRIVQETADCLSLMRRLECARTDLRDQTAHTDRLVGELDGATRRLASVRDTERRRVAAEIIGLGTVPLGHLRALVGELDEQITAGAVPTGPGSVPGRLTERLDDMIEDFRTMVRGIHPITLQARGLSAAIAEMAGGLPRPVRLTGSVPARIDTELAATVYHFVANLLLTLARDSSRATIEVRLGHTDRRLAVRVTSMARMSAIAVRAALAVDVDRLSALGGEVRIDVQDGVDGESDGDVLTVSARLPDSLEPPARAQSVATSGLPARVRALALEVTARFHDRPGSALAQALILRLDGPVHLDTPGLEPVRRAALARHVPEVLVRDPEVADRPDDSGGPDAVLRRASAPDRFDILLAGTDDGVLVRSAAWPALPGLIGRELVTRAELLRARAVLDTTSSLLRRYPLPREENELVAYQIEQIRTQAHELLELVALTQLRGDGLRLPRAQLRAADRLLGSEGREPFERLNLPSSAGPDELRRAATEQMQPWRDLAKHAVTRRQRETCEAIVRSCERLLTALAADPLVEAGGERR